MRYTKKSTIESLRDDIKNYLLKRKIEDFEEIELLGSKFCKDIQKIQVDFENFTLVDSFYEDFVLKPECINPQPPLPVFETCWYQLEDYAIALCRVGGDWEEPVFLAVYIDPDNQLRGYFPEKGNSFNPETRMAFGNNEEMDEKYKDKNWNGQGTPFKDLYDIPTMLEDIKNRIKVKEN